MRLCENAVSCADTLWKPVLAGTLAGKELGQLAAKASAPWHQATARATPAERKLLHCR